MRDNKKGLSTVVTTLIIILLVLVAIGIIWVVVRGVVESGTSEFDAAARCLKLDVRATTVTCAAVNDCTVVVERKAGGDEIGGVKLVFKNTSLSTSGAVLDQQGDIPALTSQTFANVDPGLADNSDSIEVTTFVKDETGTEFVCTGTNKFSF